MKPELSVQQGPFPIACVNQDAIVRSSNAAWDDIAGGIDDAVAALGLESPDIDDFRAALAQVVESASPQWLDVNAHSLAARRWARCHLWPADAPGEVMLAVVPVREPRDTEVPQTLIDQIEAVLDHTADAITIIGADMSLRFVSGIATRFLGASGSRNEGANALVFVHEADQESVIAAFATCLDNPRLSVKVRFRARHEDESLVWVEAIGTNMFDDPAINGVLVTLNDITELVEARASAEEIKAALEAEKLRFEMLAQFTPTGLFELTPELDVTYRNERFDHITGLSNGDPFTWDVIDPLDRDDLQTALRGTATGPVQTTVRLDTRSGEQKWVTIRAARQLGSRILASIEDNTSEVTAREELAHRAGHDDLTGLPNREHLLERLTELTAAQEPLALLFMDLDGFKDINDGLGHSVGDRVLVEVADRIQSVVRPDDIVGRLHGDEFLVVCRRTSKIARANEIAHRLVEAVALPLETQPGLIVSGSVGIAMNGGDATEPLNADQLLVDADVAMYEAKRLGGARSVTFTTDLGKRAGDRLRLHGEMQRAAELDELEVHYQPIVDLRTGEAVRVEALVRWHHPTQGFILPDRFIPDIEKSDLIDELGAWVLDKVVRRLAQLGPAALPTNVNVSPRQLADPDFARTTASLLRRAGVPAQLLTVELTEMVHIDHFGPVEEQLQELRQAGIGTAVDDFGTGYSALAYLHRFPFDQIKIDGVFIEGVDSSTQDRAIVESVINLADSLGAEAIAERVERLGQVETLIELGCSFAQGFYLGMPAPVGLE